MTVRIGLIGAGMAAHYHLANFDALADVELVAVADPSKEAARKVSTTFHCKEYSDAAEMLKKEALDAAYICSPHFARGEVEGLCAERGLHIFLEKPVALTLEVATAIDSEVRNSGILTSVGYHWRYNDLVDEARKAIRPEEVGMVQGFWMSGMRKAPWFGTRSKSGGQLVEQASHIFDLARYMVGEVVAVTGLAGRCCLADLAGFDIDDVSAVLMRFGSGAIGIVTATCMLSPHIESIWVSTQARRVLNKLHSNTGLGRHLSIRRDYKVGITLLGKDRAVDLEERTLRIIRGERCRSVRRRRNPYLVEDEAFIGAVRSGDSSAIRCDLDEGIRSLRLTLAAAESTMTEGRINLGDGS